jgi:hypothetical protein
LSYSNTIKIRLTFYESGTSISENNVIYTSVDTPGLTNLFISANQDARMKDIYRKILSNYYQNGLIQNGSTTMLFSSIGLPSKYGSWGVLDYADQINENPTHPKFQAILDFNSNPS